MSLGWDQACRVQTYHCPSTFTWLQCCRPAAGCVIVNYFMSEISNNWSGNHRYHARVRSARQLHRQTAQLHHIICPTYLSVSIWQSKQSITAIRIKLFKVHKHDYGENLHDWNTCIGCIKGDFCTWAEYATSGPNFDVTIRNKSSVSGSRWPED